MHEVSHLLIVSKGLFKNYNHIIRTVISLRHMILPTGALSVRDHLENWARCLLYSSAKRKALAAVYDLRNHCLVVASTGLM